MSFIDVFLVVLLCSAEESFKGLIQGTYTDYSAEDSDYPDTSNIMKLSSFPSPVPTKASIALAATRQREKAKSEVCK